MDRTDSLKELLEDLSRVFNEGDRLNVKFDDTSYAAQDGTTVAVAPNVRETLGKTLSGPNELRVVVDTLSHEVEHVRESVLTGKQEFAEEFPAYPKIAGAVMNIVEDQYIDYTRGRRFKGTRRTQAFVIDALMSNGHRRPPLDSIDRREGQLIEGFLQVSFAGYAKGIGDESVDDDVREYLAWARDRVNDARHEPDADRREEIARELTENMIALFPPKPEIDLQDLAELIDDLATDDVDADIPEDGEPDIDGPTIDFGELAEESDDEGADGDRDDGEGDGPDADDERDSEPTIDVDALLAEYDADALAVVD